MSTETEPPLVKVEDGLLRFEVEDCIIIDLPDDLPTSLIDYVLNKATGTYDRLYGDYISLMTCDPAYVSDLDMRSLPDRVKRFQRVDKVVAELYQIRDQLFPGIATA